MHEVLVFISYRSKTKCLLMENDASLESA